MPENRRNYGPLAESLANRGQNGGGMRGFFRGLGRGIARGFNATPIGHVVRGDFQGGFNATPVGQTIAMLRGGDPIGPNNSRAYLEAHNNPFSGATASGSVNGPFSGARVNGSVSGSGDSIFSGGMEGGASSGAFPWGDGPLTVSTLYGHGAQRAADQGINAGYNTSTMGYTGSTNPLLAANAVNAGVGGLQMNSPWKQSGVFFNDRQQEF